MALWVSSTCSAAWGPKFKFQHPAKKGQTCKSLNLSLEGWRQMDFSNSLARQPSWNLTFWSVKDPVKSDGERHLTSYSDLCMSTPRCVHPHTHMHATYKITYMFEIFWLFLLCLRLWYNDVIYPVPVSSTFPYTPPCPFKFMPSFFHSLLLHICMYMYICVPKYNLLSLKLFKRERNLVSLRCCWVLVASPSSSWGEKDENQRRVDSEAPREPVASVLEADTSCHDCELVLTDSVRITLIILGGIPAHPVDTRTPSSRV